MALSEVASTSVLAENISLDMAPGRWVVGVRERDRDR
jgi:hypothetical protein